MQFKPRHLLNQMTKHNAAPESSQDSSSISSVCEGSSDKAGPSRPSSPEGKSRTPPRSRRLDPFGIFWKMIIRPPRAEYSLDELGPKAFRIDGASGSYIREDIQLANLRGERLECSHFRAHPARGKDAPRASPCVVYLHGNCSSRLEALDVLDELLPRGFSVFCFDFTGSGHSDGEYVTLGHNEEQDLQVVLEHLRKSIYVNSIALWGRSMGAATSIFRAAEDHSIAACILDSPFASLPDVARELAQSIKLKMPEIMIGAMLKRIRGEIKSRTDVDIEELRPIDSAPKARAPALFAVAKDDEFVQAHHTFALHDAWGGEERELVTLGGGHNSSRPREFLSHAADFLQEQFKKREPKPELTAGQRAAFCRDGASSTTSTQALSSPTCSQDGSRSSSPKSARSQLHWRPSLDLPVTCRAALARAGLGFCLDGCLAGVAAATGGA